jgi:perosamine synthetase
MSNLALLGGTPVLPQPLPAYRSMGEAERDAVRRVMETDCISGFYGSPGDEFFGGPKVREFEATWAAQYGCKHAISMNSNTSGLIASMGAIGLSPGEEVILPPWTMSATAMAPLFYGGIPVFVDIEDETFCLDPELVRRELTDKTRAILAVNIFGHPARLAELREMADAHGIYLIEDNAQAPLATEAGRAAGTIGHIGVFSLNYHKHIHTGEGGICTTDDNGLAQRLAMLRNHGENAVEWLVEPDLCNMMGFNFRLTEIAAAIGLEQLKRIDEHVERRERLAHDLTEGTADLAGWQTPKVRPGCRHNYYIWHVRFDEDELGISRETFSKALLAEGFPHFTGYLPPLYRLPLFRQRIAMGREGFPFSLTNRTYHDGMCPVTERLHHSEAVLFEPCAYDVDGERTEQLIEAVRKVHANIDDLRGLDQERA